MATKIITKNSSTASSVPTPSDLVQGELAVNVADKRLFTENAAGSIVELGTNPSSITTANITVSGTTTGAISSSSATITGGTVNGVVIGGSTPAAITGTTVTASTGFVGNITGDVTGNADTATTATTAGSVSGVVGVANGGTALSSTGGLGNVLMSDGSAWVSSPLVAGALPSAGIAVSTGTLWDDSIVPGTGVATALGVNVGSAGAFTTFNGAAGTPTSLTLTNATGLPIGGGGTGLDTLGTANQILAVNSGATALEYVTITAQLQAIALSF